MNDIYADIHSRVFAQEPNEAAALDNIERRFAWFKRTLTRHEAEAGRLFPEEWKVEWALGGMFIDITR